MKEVQIVQYIESKNCLETLRSHKKILHFKKSTTPFSPTPSFFPIWLHSTPPTLVGQWRSQLRKRPRAKLYDKILANNDIMQVLSKTYKTTNKKQDITF